MRLATEVTENTESKVMAVQYACPGCKKVLRAANPIAAGKKIKCPSCEKVFAPESAGTDDVTRARVSDGPVRAKKAVTRIQEEERPPPRRDAVQANKPMPKAVFDEDDEDAPPQRDRDRPARKSRDRDDDDFDSGQRPSRKKKKKAKGPPVALVIGLGVVAPLIVILAITGFIWPGFLLSKGPGVVKNVQPGPGPMAMPGPGGMPAPGPMGGEWQVLDAKEFGFKVSMPGVTKTMTQNVGGLTMNIFMLDRGATSFVVMHQRNPFSAKGKEKFILQEAVKGLGTKGRVTKSNFINVQGFEAVDLRATMNNPPGLEVRDLVIINDDRMYQVMAGGSREFVESEEAQKFVNSFQITK